VALSAIGSECDTILCSVLGSICIGVLWSILKSIVHQQKVFQSVGASRCGGNKVEYKFISIKYWRVSDHRRVFQLAFNVTSMSNNFFRSGMGVSQEGFAVY